MSVFDSCEIVLGVKKFSISYKSPTDHMFSLRDKFVGAFKDPASLFFDHSDKLQVLDDISFDVKRGETVGLIGGNGVGKTSLCRYLAGIIDSKQIKCSGHIRAVFDTNISLYPNLTGLENTIVLTNLMFPELSRSDRDKIVKEALEFSDLKEFIHMPLNKYSKGMKSRLYLSIVTSRPADLLILDEIFGATDIYFAEKLSSRMKNMIEGSGAAIIVSHNMDDIRRYCNKLIYLADKKIQYFGEVEEGIALYESKIK